MATGLIIFFVVYLLMGAIFGLSTTTSNSERGAR